MSYLTLYFTGRTVNVQVPANQQPDDVLRSMENNGGIWNGLTYYPWHALLRAKLVVQE